MNNLELFHAYISELLNYEMERVRKELGDNPDEVQKDKITYQIRNVPTEPFRCRF